MYILDTDHLTLLQRQVTPEADCLSRRLVGCPPSDVYTTIVSFHEQIQGWTAYLAKAKDQQQIVRGYDRLNVLLLIYQQAQVLPFSLSAATVYDELRRLGIRIGTMDLRIASIAIANQMTVLTRNTVDFSKIPGLTIEDWTIASQ